METTVQEYYEIVKRFSSFVEELVISEDRLEELMSLLLQLYEKALHLPDTEPNETDDYVYDEYTVLPLKMEVRNFYWEVYDPYDDKNEDKLVCGMIFDDLNDIYRDLQEGVRAFEAGDINEAAWVWKFGVNDHWGTHAVSLIKALHWMRTVHGALMQNDHT